MAPGDRPSDAERRARAEQRLRTAAGTPEDPASYPDLERAVHELRVHQIELEMQNDELRRAQLDTEEALARYEELYDHAPAGYLTLGPDGTILQLNLAAAALLGDGRDALRHQPFGSFLSIEDRAVVEAELAAVATTPRTLAVTLSSGTVEIELLLSRGEDRQTVRVVALDVTVRNRMAQRVRATETMAAIGRLTAGVAHDFNNMLAIILAHAEFGLGGLPPGHDVRADLEQVYATTTRAAALVQQLMAFTRAGRVEAVVVDLNILTSLVVESVRATLRGDITVELQLSETPCQVQAAASQIEQILLNLLVNARDAMPGAGTLTIATRTVELDGLASHTFGVTAGSFVMVSVQDTGVGMDEVTTARMFEPMFSTKPRGTGGFGLTTVYAIVKRHGGDMKVRSERGKGTTFEIYLPRAAGPITPEVSATLAAPGGGSEVILVVDDEVLLLLATARSLSRVGYTVLTARSGVEALAVAAEHPILDLVVTDVVMPGMTGPELAVELQLLRPGLPVLYVSGYAGTAPGGGVTAGLTPLLDKPFSGPVLLRRVRELLDARSTS